MKMACKPFLLSGYANPVPAMPAPEMTPGGLQTRPSYETSCYSLVPGYPSEARLPMGVTYIEVPISNDWLFVQFV